MRILFHGAPPIAPSGYGKQAGMAARAIRDLGHDVAISCYAGWFAEPEWEGMPVFSGGSRLMGNGLLAGHYARWEADLLVLFGDSWTFDPSLLGGVRVMPWMPLDCDPLGRMDRHWLEVAAKVCGLVQPAAMSQFGADRLAEAGYSAAVVPHAAGAVYRPDAEAGRRWRASLRVPDEAFVVGKVAVNNEDDRKALEVTMLAFARVAAKRRNAVLYLHCEPQVPKAPDLLAMAASLGLGGRVAFPDPYRRGADQYSDEDMKAMYNGLSVLDAASKGEGFGVPVVEALACGTPVIGCRNSAATEKIRPEWGWLVGGQRTWARHHQSWWMMPDAGELARAYDKSAAAGPVMRSAAAAAGREWSEDNMRDGWAKALSTLADDHVRIFGSARWGEPGEQSGSGSDPEVAMPYLKFLSDYMHEHEIKSVLDLGSGDGRLAAAVHWPGTYTGLDALNGDDIRTCPWPDADLVLVKDVFQHWPAADIQALLPRLEAYPHVLITGSAAGVRVNEDIAAGGFRSVDLAAEPFSWPVTEVFRWVGDEEKMTVRLAPPAGA